MKCLDPELEQNQTPLNIPIAVLRCGYGEIELDEQPNRTLEQTDCSPFGTISSFQFEKTSYTVFKLHRADRQHAVFRNNHIDAVQLVYMLEGSCKLRIDGIKTQQLHPGEYHRVFFPMGSNVSIEFAIEGDITLVIIDLEQQYFLSYLPLNSPLYHTLISQGSKADSRAANLTPFHIMPDQFSALHSIIDCKRQDFIKHHYINAKIDELLVLHLEQSVLLFSVENQRQDLRDEELQRIYKVRDMLRQEPEKSYSLVGLAHAVGTNDATLKKHVK